MGAAATTNPNMTYYLLMWKEMLPALLGWDEERAVHWVKDTGLWDYMTDPNDILYHETPQYWIKHLLVPDELRRRLSTSDVIGLELRILAAFREEHHYEFPVGTDWRPFRKKIERILSEYGASLERPGGPAGQDASDTLRRAHRRAR